MSKIIGLGHQLHVGKDTVGKIMLCLDARIPDNEIIPMLNNWNYIEEDVLSRTPLRIAKFAANLKAGLELDFPKEFSVVEWENSGAEYRNGIMPSLGKSRRVVLQERGNILRSIHPKYWINSLLNGVDNVHTLIITDMRYVNEADTIKELGGIAVKVFRDLETDGAISETELIGYNFDWLIDNTRDLSYLVDQVSYFFDVNS